MARATLLSVLLGLLFIGARCQECVPIVDAATEAGLTTFLAALEAAGLVDTVVAATDLTVFAPSNEAFDAALTAVGITLDELVANTPLLTEILTYHVLPTRVPAADIADGDSFTTLLGEESTCGVSTLDASIGDGVLTLVGGVTNATVETPDVETCQGIVHVIDFVLLPCPLGEEPDTPPAEGEEECTPLLEAAAAADLTTLLAAVEAAGLLEAIQAPGLTIFAPTNDAFDAVVTALGITIDDLVTNIDVLTEILLYHVLGTTVRSGDIQDGATTETLLGNDSSCGVSAVTFDLTEGVVVQGGASSATVVTPDVETCTAVVHVVDSVLLPCDLTPPEGEPTPQPDGEPTPQPDGEPTPQPDGEPTPQPDGEGTPTPATDCTPIVEAAQTAGLTTLLAALDAAGLVDAVVSPAAPLTVFAPTNEAFDAAASALGVTIHDLVNSKDALTEILLYHVLGTTVRAGDIRDGAIAETLLGEDSSCGVSALTFALADGVVVKGGETSATVVTADVETCSAVVHVIDSVLVPCPLERVPRFHPGYKKHHGHKKHKKGIFIFG